MVIKVRDLAKEVGLSNEDILEQLRKLYVDVEDEKSVVDDKIAGLIRIKLGVPKTKKKPAKKKEKAGEEKNKDKITVKKKSERSKEEKAKEAEKIKKAAEKKKAESEEQKDSEEKTEEILPEFEAGKIRKIKSAEKVEESASAKSPKSVAKPTFVVEEILAGQKKPKPSVKRGKKVKRVRRQVIEVVEKGARSKGGARFGKKRGSASIFQKGKFAQGEGSTAARKTPKKIEVQIPVNIRSLAPRIMVKPSLIIQYLMGQGAAISINQDLEEDLVRDIMSNFGFELELPETVESMEKELISEITEIDTAVESRPSVVTFMGHVDHGKTSLLDYIRKTMVTKGEKGGITQHIGAYKVKTNGGSVTFLDTPGHAAFTAMRARGANATDVVVLVVAADDGVMPQTKEAIDHARAAGVPIVVAINKCDLPGADPGMVKQDLQKEDLMSEEWGGSTIMTEVSAITGEGVDDLVEMLMLESEMLELKANPKLRARGVVIESKKTPGQGIVATLLIQNGTLRAGDVVLCGSYYGRVKAMSDDTGRQVEAAGPSTPVEILGLQGVPEAGDEFFVVKDEKKAKTLAMLKQGETRKRNIAGGQGVTLEDFHNRVMEGTMKELNIILKADVQGSEEALKHSLEELATDEVKVNIIHSTVGNINESDVMLAVVSNAIIVGFHVKIDVKAESLAKSEKVDVHKYDVIYEAIADVKAGMEGLLEPEEKEIFQGRAQVLEVFSASKIGKAAGCMITKGVIHRKDRIRVRRGEEIVHEGEIHALRRFKDDAREVREGFECGVSLKNFNNIREKDIIEAFIIEKVARRLEK